MARNTFPRRRDDGTFSVGLRFSSDVPLDSGPVAHTVQTWIEHRRDRVGSGLDADLDGVPRVVQLTPTSVEVVLNGSPGSRRWKDLMADLGREIAAQRPGVRFEGFHDVVADVMHPGSLGKPDLFSPG